MDNVPDRGPFVIASNHISYVDALVLAHLLLDGKQPSLWLKMLSKAELFVKAPMKWIMRGWGHIPVYRESTQAGDALRDAYTAIDKGDTLGIFVEGTISLTLVPMAPHTGAARIALKTGCPIIPVGIWGTHRSAGKYHKRDYVKHRPVTIDIGEAMTFESGDVKEVSDEIMTEVVRNVEAARDRYPDKAQPRD